MRPAVLGCSALASALVMGCSEPSAPTAPVADAERVAPRTADLVTRFSAPFFDLVVDGDLVALVGIGPAQLSAFCLGDESVLDPVHVQEVTRPDGSFKITVRGRPRLVIYSISGVSDLCDLTTASALAVGRAQFSQTDNDLAVSLNRTNSFGSNLNGVASGRGGRYKVQARFRVTIQRNGDFRVRNERTRIKPLRN